MRRGRLLAGGGVDYSADETPREAVLGEVLHAAGSEPEHGWFILGVNGYFDVDNACWCEHQDGDAPWTTDHFELFGTVPALVRASVVSPERGDA